MAQQRLSMRKIREILRLKAAGLSHRQIAATIGSARSTVQECLRRAQARGSAGRCPRSWMRARWRRCCIRRSVRCRVAAAGLRAGARELRAPGRDAAAAVAGVQGRSTATACSTAPSAISIAAGSPPRSW